MPSQEGSTLALVSTRDPTKNLFAANKANEAIKEKRISSSGRKGGVEQKGEEDRDGKEIKV